MDSMSFSNKKVVVTGANGFIGSHMTMRMLEEKAQVCVIVRESN